MSESGEPSGSGWSKLGLLVVDKLLLAVVAAVAILFFQNRLQLSQERLEKAKHIGEISVDRPVAIVAGLPGHLDAFILYAEHIRAHDLEHISSEHLTELQAAISTDIEGSRAYYSDDIQLKWLETQIKKAIRDVRAKALTKNSLGPQDLSDLEKTREWAFNFYGRIICLSVQRAKNPFDTVGECPHPL